MEKITKNHTNVSISTNTTLALLRKMLEINGFLWTACVVPYVLLRKLKPNLRIHFLNQYLRRLEAKHNLPGMNSEELNVLIWETWNWEMKGGEEWTISPEWKQSIIDDVMLKYLTPGKAVLEIGPGAGKWTSTLQQIAQKLVIVDISSKCIEVCKKGFSDCTNISYFVTRGSNLSFLQNNSIDFIWSYDVFVHIAPADIEIYIEEFQRVLKPGGRGVIHHAGEGGNHGGWRSKLTNRLFVEFLEKNKLQLVSQFDSWGDTKQFDLKHYHDSITVFEKA